MASIQASSSTCGSLLVSVLAGVLHVPAERQLQQLPLPERDHVQPAVLHLRLVVQRRLRRLRQLLPAQPVPLRRQPLGYEVHLALLLRGVRNEWPRSNQPMTTHQNATDYELEQPQDDEQEMMMMMMMMNPTPNQRQRRFAQVYGRTAHV